MTVRITTPHVRYGFTLAEVVVVVAIIGLLITVTAVPFRSILTARSAADAARTYAYALRDAAMRARMMDADTAWGVRIASTTVTVFSGATYATRTASRDRTFSIASSAATAGPLEVVFAKFTGVPSTMGTTSFSTTVATSSVGVNTRGTVSVSP